MFPWRQHKIQQRKWKPSVKNLFNFNGSSTETVHSQCCLKCLHSNSKCLRSCWFLIGFSGGRVLVNERMWGRANSQHPIIPGATEAVPVGLELELNPRHPSGDPSTPEPQVCEGSSGVLIHCCSYTCQTLLIGISRAAVAICWISEES